MLRSGKGVKIALGRVYQLLGREPLVRHLMQDDAKFDSRFKLLLKTLERQDTDEARTKRLFQDCSFKLDLCSKFPTVRGKSWVRRWWPEEVGNEKKEGQVY